MKRLMILASVLTILLTACKNKDEECFGENCPLSSGEFCANGFVNINDNCVCPEGQVDFGEYCREKNSGSFYFDINCLCFDYLSVGFPNNGVSFTHIIGGETEQYLSGFQGTLSAFEIEMFRPCVLPDGATAKPFIVGSIVDSTMSFEIEWRFFYWQDANGEIFLNQPDPGEFVAPLLYLDSISDYSCGTIYTADQTP